MHLFTCMYIPIIYNFRTLNSTWIRQCGAGCKHDSHVILDYAVIIYKIELENRV